MASPPVSGCVRVGWKARPRASRCVTGAPRRKRNFPPPVASPLPGQKFVMAGRHRQHARARALPGNAVRVYPFK